MHPLLVFASLVAGPAAGEIYNVPAGSKSTINRHGVCRVVNNIGTHPIMVPTLDRREWHEGAGAFLNNTGTMPNVSVQACYSETPTNLNMFLRVCSDTVLDSRFFNPHINPDHPGRAGEVADNYFYGNLENSCGTWPVRGSDGRIYVEYKQGEDLNGNFAVRRWFNDQGQIINPTALGLTFSPLNLPTCVTPPRTEIDSATMMNTSGHTRPAGMTWGEYLAHNISRTVDFGQNWVFASEGGYWAYNHSPRLRPWLITLGRETISASWPADPTAEGCKLDFMTIHYQSSMAQTFAFIFIKEWENGPALLD